MNDMFVPKPSQLITNTMQYTEYNLYLHGKIGDPDDFMEHFSVFKMANEGDVVNLYITSEGGSLSTGMEFIRHMKECRAPIIGILGVEVASMASAIAMECDEIEVDEMTTMLIHSFSYGAIGTESSVYNQAAFNNKLNERWIRKHYSDFLDETQLSDIFKGVDILLNSDEIIERWEHMQEMRSERGCGDESCTDCNQDSMPSIDSIIEDAVASGVEQGLAAVLKKYELVERPKKPSRAKKPKPVEDECGIVVGYNFKDDK
jgi:ATP-dependent protease ClpP protease subunit